MDENKRLRMQVVVLNSTQLDSILDLYAVDGIYMHIYVGERFIEENGRVRGCSV